MAADSRATGNFVMSCDKLYRSNTAIIGFCGEIAQALVFVDWYFNRKKRKPDIAYEQDWWALVLKARTLEFWDRSLRPEIVREKFMAIGSGSALAMGAMEFGATAEEAVEIACRRDPYCAPPVVTMRL